MHLDPLDFRMRAERTPNPNSVKWVLSSALLEPGRSAHFETPVAAEVSPLAARLFAIEGVTGVFMAANFVTVTKQPEIEWPALAQSLVDEIKEFAASGAPSPRARLRSCERAADRRGRGAHPARARRRDPPLRRPGWRRRALRPLSRWRRRAVHAGLVQRLPQCDRNAQDGHRGAAPRGRSRSPGGSRDLGRNLARAAWPPGARRGESKRSASTISPMRPFARVRRTQARRGDSVGRGGYVSLLARRRRRERRRRRVIAATVLCASFAAGVWLVRSTGAAPEPGASQPALPAVASGAADTLLQLARYQSKPRRREPAREQLEPAPPPPPQLPAELLATLPPSARLAADGSPAWPAALAEAPRDRVVERSEVVPGTQGVFGPVEVEYTLDAALTERVVGILRDVELAHVIVMDPADGRILSYASTEPRAFPADARLPDGVTDEGGDGVRGAESGARCIAAAVSLHRLAVLPDPEPARPALARSHGELRRRARHLEQPVLRAARGTRAGQPRRDRPDGAARHARGTGGRAPAGRGGSGPRSPRTRQARLGPRRFADLAARGGAPRGDARGRARRDAVLDRTRPRRERHGASRSRSSGPAPGALGRGCERSCAR